MAVENRETQVKCYAGSIGAEPCQDWAPIPGFSGYEASIFGLIRNSRGKVLKQRLAGNGALQVNLGKAVAMVHNLILRTFTGRPPTKGYYPKWLNDDKSDNRLVNLVWAGKGNS